MDHSKSLLASVDLLKQFDEQIGSYDSFCQTTADLIKRLLAAKKITVHSISYRCKERPSFERKIIKKGRYKSLSDITDLAGIRIITHYSDDVDVIASLIENEFEIDKANSIDKRVVLDPDRFGYLSLHYVASLKSARIKLQEYANYSNMKLEIQIRSILQHTWAEIEHDIGYKSEVDVPGPIKRKFSRLAGLLELADQEFISIRKEIVRYAKNLDKQMSGAIKNVGLDAISYEKFITKNPGYIKLDAEVREACGFTLGEYHDDSRAIKRLASLGVTTVDKLSFLLKEYKEDILRMGRRVSSELPDEIDESTDVAPGIAAFYLCHVLAAMQDEQFIDSYLADNSWGDDSSSYEFRNILVGFF